MAKRDLASDLRQLKQRTELNHIMLRRDSPLLALMDIKEKMQNAVGWENCLICVGLCSVIEVYAKATTAEAFDEYFFAISADAIKNIGRFNNIKLDISQYIGSRQNDFTFWLLISSGVKINSIDDFASLMTDIFSIHEEAPESKFFEYLKSFSSDLLNGESSNTAIDGLKKLFELRHQIVHEVPFGQKIDGDYIVCNKEMINFVLAVEWLLAAADDFFSSIYFPRIGAQPYVEASILDSNEASDQVERWNKRLLSIVEDGARREEFRRAQVEWEAYARTFSDAWGMRFIGTGTHTSRAEKYISLSSNRIRELREVIQFETEINS